MLGIKIIKAIIALVRVKTNSAAEAVSLATLASGWNSLVTRSTVLSIEVFISSTTKVNPIIAIIINHSVVDKLRKKLSNTKITVHTKCIYTLCSFL